jgi:glucokinase-like ROK family protein
MTKRPIRDPETVPPSAQLDALVEVLDQVRDGRAETRPELIARTGLSRAVVLQRVAELISRGLLEEAELGPSTGGRAPRLLRFRADTGFVLVADLGATHTGVAAADLSGRIIAHVEEPSDIAAGPELVLGRVQALFDQILAETSGLPKRLWGIGIGVPGPVEFTSGRPVAPPIMPGWDRYPVRDEFARRYDVPVWVDNDVNVMALGEVRAGAGRDHDAVVCVKIGTGIGAGIVAGGKLLRGAQGCAGDVGHIQITDDPSIVCRCGKIGCLEALAGGGAIARRATEAAREGRSPVLASMLAEREALTATDVATAASRGDQVALELFNEAGHLVGSMLAMVVNLLNPSLVLVGGGVVNAGDSLLASIRQTVYGRSLPLATRDLAIVRGALGHTAGVIGAASMVVDELFARDRLACWLEAGHPAGRPELAALAA